MKKSKFTAQIEKRLISQTPKKFKAGLKPEDFVRGNKDQFSELKFLNLTVPQVRAEVNRLLQEKPSHDSDNFLEHIEKLWFESDIFEAKSVAVIWLETRSTDFLKKYAKRVLSWATAIDNWAHSDGLCSIFAKIYELQPHTIQPVYLKWNKHKNPWLRRCSMVGLYYYSRQRQNPAAFKLACQLVSPHFAAPEYYVQKGVGWTIREMYNVYPNETIKFIENNLNEISSIAWVAASEKLAPKIKTPLLEQRRSFRKKIANQTTDNSNC